VKAKGREAPLFGPSHMLDPPLNTVQSVSSCSASFLAHLLAKAGEHRSFISVKKHTLKFKKIRTGAMRDRHKRSRGEVRCQ